MKPTVIASIAKQSLYNLTDCFPAYAGFLLAMTVKK